MFDFLDRHGNKIEIGLYFIIYLSIAVFVNLLLNKYNDFTILFLQIFTTITLSWFVTNKIMDNLFDLAQEKKVKQDFEQFKQRVTARVENGEDFHEVVEDEKRKLIEKLDYDVKVNVIDEDEEL